MEDLRTSFVIQKEARELRIYSDFMELANRPGAMKTKVTKIICDKYGIHSAVTLLQMRKRVEKRLEQQTSVSTQL